VLSLDVGGLERIVIDLVRIGHRRGDRVSVICLEKEGNLAEVAEKAGATVHCLRKPPGRRPEVIPVAASLLASLRPDVLHTHQIGPAWYMSQVARSFRIPLIHTEHGDPFARASRPLRIAKLRLFYAQTARRLRLFCCVSQDIAKVMGRFRTVPSRLLAVVPNGIRTDEVEGLPTPEQVRAQWTIPKDALVLGTVGRLDEVKRQDLLLEAFRKVADRHATSYLLLVGDGPERANLERKVSLLGLQDRVRFAGFQREPEAYYRAMDLFALTSRSEGLPVSLLEAWAASKPILCTAVGGIPAVVTDGVDGKLVSSGDVDATAAAMGHLMEDSDRRRRMGEAGRKKVLASYSLDRMADAYRSRYDQIRCVSPRKGDR
jgi:glycosyltransferase involved in cell wall biosynthesis